MSKYLYTQKQIQEYFMLFGVDVTKENRQTGKSTAIALKTIAKAIENPGQVIYIVDHFNQAQSNRSLAYEINGMITKLNLRGLDLKNNLAGSSLVFNLFEPNAKEQHNIKFGDKMDKLLK